MRGGGYEGKPKETYQQYAMDCSPEEDCMANYNDYVRAWTRANPQAIMEANMNDAQYSQYKTRQGQAAYQNNLVADRSRFAPSSPTAFAPSSPSRFAPSSPTAFAPSSPSRFAPSSPTAFAPSSPPRKRFFGLFGGKKGRKTKKTRRTRRRRTNKRR
jgi:hypothetical protein